jgi:hypothetical protein
MSFHDELIYRGQQYAAQYGLVLGKELGFGVHGIVFEAESQAVKGRCAVKIHSQEPAYCRERDVYLRLRERHVVEIQGFHVPELRQFDDDWLVIDMTVVQRPFVLDFAGAYLDGAPDFSEEVMADWRTDKVEQFGERWPKAEAILRILETYGIFMEDVHPNNISFAD